MNYYPTETGWSTNSGGIIAIVKGGQTAVLPVYHQASTLIFPTTSSQDHAVPRLVEFGGHLT